jgi:hypothetical protein
MAIGPVLIFDKSTLQSLSADEALWLDNFFLTNITPLFFIETLADLEKEMKKGRTPEQAVGHLAYKTPDMGSRPNAHHTVLIAGELLGHPIELRGVTAISGGQAVTLEGKTGMVYKETPEEEAFNRWQGGEFLDVERQIAKNWRRALSNISWDQYFAGFQKFFVDGVKPKTLQDVKALADRIVDSPDQEYILRFGMDLLNVAEDWQERVVARWRKASFPSLRKFAPYFVHVLTVDLFFYLGIASSLISKDRPSHKVDLAYLYYLPFCMVFTSSDKFHATIAPLFLTADQSFVPGAELKADLRRLDEHYSKLPQDVKEKGLFAFASDPPEETDFLITRIWDKHLPRWRELKQKRSKEEPLAKEKQEALVNLVNRTQKATPLGKDVVVPQEEIAHLTITRRVHMRKGKWNRFPPHIKPD